MPQRAELSLCEHGESATDAELVELSRSGDRSAFGKLASRHARTVLIVALAVVSDPDVAEDIAQDALVRAWTSLDRCRNPERFGAWLHTIVRRTALNRLARRERRARLRRWFLADLLGRKGRDANAEGSEKAGALGGSLAAAIASLGARQRQVLLLHDLEEHSHSEIAELMDITVATSRKHLSEARRRVREALTRGEDPK